MLHFFTKQQWQLSLEFTVWNSLQCVLHGLCLHYSTTFVPSCPLLCRWQWNLIVLIVFHFLDWKYIYAKFCHETLDDKGFRHISVRFGCVRFLNGSEYYKIHWHCRYTKLDTATRCGDIFSYNTAWILLWLCVWEI